MVPQISSFTFDKIFIWRKQCIYNNQQYFTYIPIRTDCLFFRENKNKYFLGMMAYLVKQNFVKEVSRRLCSALKLIVNQITPIFNDLKVTQDALDLCIVQLLRSNVYTCNMFLTLRTCGDYCQM